MPTWQPDLAPFVGRISRLHSLLKALGDEMHADVGVTAGMRAIMSSLAAADGRTVPNLARAQGVSRQHVQSVINELLAAGLVAGERNPSHRRSPLLVLTDEGLRRLRTVEAREAEYLTRIAPAVSHLELAAASRLFDHLERDLAAQLADPGGR
jgi:DNA-binding MarR family transcriptional regulator